jgi:hypothetical protein
MIELLPEPGQHELGKVYFLGPAAHLDAAPVDIDGRGDVPDIVQALCEIEHVARIVGFVDERAAQPFHIAAIFFRGLNWTACAARAFSPWPAVCTSDFRAARPSKSRRH